MIFFIIQLKSISDQRTTTTTNEMTTIAASTTDAHSSYIRSNLGLIACGDIPMFEHYCEDEDEEVYEAPRAPFMNLTKEERDEKSKMFKFGLCCECDSGLGDKSDFVCHNRPNGAFVMMCNECNYYHYMTEVEMYVAGEHGGCN